VDFEEGEPFRPFEQLMGVLPAASSHALPPAFHPLMKDPDSPIIDFYPEKFDLDMNGKRFTWQAVALLPWIDEKRLLAETRSLDCTLTNEEKRRNTINLETLLCHASHPLARDIYELEDENPGRDVKKTKHMNPATSGNMNGEMILVNGDTCPTSMPSPMKSRDDITNNQVLAVCLKLPGPTERFVPPVLMPGVRLPDPIVNPQDMPPAPKLWHVDQPRGPYGAQEFNHPSRRGPGPMGLGGYQNGGGGRGGGHSGHSGPGLSAGAHRLLQASVHAGTGGNVMQYGHGPPGHGPPHGNYYQQQQNYGNYPPAPPTGMPGGYPGPPMGGYPQPPGGHNGGRGYPGPPHGGRGGRGGGRGPPPPQGNSFAALANPPDEDPRYRR
jgi:5'-3' exoribonuclease 2